MGTKPPALVGIVKMEDAVRCVAGIIAASRGDESHGPLTLRQERLIKYYVRGSTGGQPASIMPSMITYSASGQTWAKYPSDPALRAEVEKALYQRDLWQEQREDALDWLESHGYKIEAQVLDGNALARDMGTDFAPSVEQRPSDQIAVVGVPQEGASALSDHPKGNEERRAIAIGVLDEVAERYRKQRKMVPNAKEHRNEAMTILRDRYQENHSTSTEVYELALARYKGQRCHRGEKKAQGLKRLALSQ